MADDVRGQTTDLREEGKRKNAEVRALAEENQRHIARYRELMMQANEAKHKRDAVNAQVKDQSAKRKDLVERAKNLDAMMKEKDEALAKMPQEGRWSPGALRRMIQDMDWRLQTSGLSPRDEKLLVMETNKLRKELEKLDKREPLMRELYDLKRQRQDISLEFRALDKALETAREESDKLHQQVLDHYKQIDEVKGKITQYLGVIGEKSKEADEVFAKLRGARDEMEEEERQRTHSEHAKKQQAAQETKLTLDERARQIYDDFKAGKKISFEDLQVLQASGIEI